MRKDGRRVAPPSFFVRISYNDNDEKGTVSPSALLFA
jgi:hypothetical protein